MVVVSKHGKRIALFDHFHAPRETLGLNIAKAVKACYPDDPDVGEWVRREKRRAAGCHSGVYGDLGIVVQQGPQATRAFCVRDPDHRAVAFAGGWTTRKP